MNEEMMMKVEGMEWGTYSGSNFFRHQTLTSIWGFDGEIKGRKGSYCKGNRQEAKHKTATTRTETPGQERSTRRKQKVRGEGWCMNVCTCMERLVYELPLLRTLVTALLRPPILFAYNFYCYVVVSSVYPFYQNQYHLYFTSS